MKINTFYPVLILLCSFFFSITAHAQIKKIYLQPKTAIRGKQSKYIDSIRFIPLEIKDGIELGAYYNLEITNQYLLVIDYMNKRLIVYSRDGSFIKNISYKKLGESFYPSYRERNNQVVFFGNNKNYALTPKDLIEVKQDWDNPRNKKYFKKYKIDLNDSSFTISKDVPEERDIIRIYNLYDDLYMHGQILTSPVFKDSLDYEIKLYQNNQLVKTYFPYNRIKEPRFLYTEQSVDFTRTSVPYINFICRPYCDTVYKLVKDSLFPAYQLVLPLENALPTSFFTKPFKNKTEKENFARNNGWMFSQIYSFYETPKFIFLDVGYLSNYEAYIYEKQTDIICKVGNIKSDSSQYNVDLLKGASFRQKGDQYYKPLRASDILPFFEKNKNAPVPKELEKFLASKPPGTTPVIAVFNFKN